MNEKINIDIDDNNLCTKTSTSINTPNIGISVATESTDKTEEATSQNETINEIPISNSKCWGLCWYYKMSFALFLSSISSAFILFKKVPLCPWSIFFLGSFSIISLILSVIVKLKTDDFRLLKLQLIKRHLNSIKKKRETENTNTEKEINLKNLSELLRVLDL